MRIPPADEKRRADLIALLRQIRAEGADPIEIVPIADALKAACPRGFGAALAEAWPDDRYRRQTLQRYRDRAAKRRISSPSSEAFVAAKPAEVKLYERLVQISHLARYLRESEILALAAERRVSPRTVAEWISAIESKGMEAVVRKPRKDRGKSRSLSSCPEAEAAFRGMLCKPALRDLPIAVMADQIRDAYPEIQSLSDAPFYRIAGRLPKMLRRPDRENRARFGPSGQWEPPYPNHTWALDYARGDIWVWDQDPDEPPYRPWLIDMIDERSRSCMFALYTKETPSRADLGAVLLHAILPKRDEDGRPHERWIQHGMPEHLHADNGKVQASQWLEEVCRTTGTELGLMGDVRHSAVRAPWQNGHAESFFRVVHTHFEHAWFPEAYAGRNPEHRPEGCKGNSGGPRDWKSYPTLEALNYGLRVWVVKKYHEKRNRMMGMTPLEHWQRYSVGHVKLPENEEQYLRQVLMQRADGDGTRLARRGQVQVNGFFYEHPLLQDYDGLAVEVRWDPADLDRVLVFSDRRLVCEANRLRIGNPSEPKDIAALQQRRREKRKATRALRLNAEEVAGMTLPERQEREAKQRAAIEREEAQRKKGTIPFRRPADRVEPQAEPAEMNLLDLFPEHPEEPAGEKLIIFGQEV